LALSLCVVFDLLYPRSERSFSPPACCIVCQLHYSTSNRISKICRPNCSTTKVQQKLLLLFRNRSSIIRQVRTLKRRQIILNKTARAKYSIRPYLDLISFTGHVTSQPYRWHAHAIFFHDCIWWPWLSGVTPIGEGWTNARGLRALGGPKPSHKSLQTLKLESQNSTRTLFIRDYV